MRSSNSSSSSNNNSTLETIHRRRGIGIGGRGGEKEDIDNRGKEVSHPAAAATGATTTTSIPNTRNTDETIRSWTSSVSSNDFNYYDDDDDSDSDSSSSHYGATSWITLHTSRHLLTLPNDDDDDDDDDDEFNNNNKPNAIIEKVKPLTLQEKHAQACYKAQKYYERDVTNYSSELFDMTNNFPQFSESEIVYGETLGYGGFGIVKEVRGFKLCDDVNKKLLSSQQQKQRVPSPPRQRRHSFTCGEASRLDVPDTEICPGETMESRKFMSNHVFRNEGHARYAIKKLKSKIVNMEGKNHNTVDLLTTAIMDMVIEARFLSAIEHPNIIKLRAIKAGNRFDINFFFVMDRLYETLPQKIQVWKKMNSKNMFRSLVSGAKRALSLRSNVNSVVDNIGHGSNNNNKIKRNSIVYTNAYQDQLVSAFHLSSALKYLHKQRLIHRDLKPDNIGFDVRGDIKIFDFGLAKEMPPLGVSTSLSGEKLVDDKGGYYNFSGMCGTPQSMAEEVAWRRPYNEKCDVYSYGVLLFEILSLQQAYATHTIQSLIEQVWSPPYLRPNVGKLGLPQSLEELIHQAWHFDYTKRPSMQHINKILKQECMKFPGVTLEDLGHQRRKSRVIYDKEIARFRLNPDELGVQGKIKHRAYQQASME